MDTLYRYKKLVKYENLKANNSYRLTATYLEKYIYNNHTLSSKYWIEIAKYEHIIRLVNENNRIQIKIYYNSIKVKRVSNVNQRVEVWCMSVKEHRIALLTNEHISYEFKDLERNQTYHIKNKYYRQMQGERKWSLYFVENKIIQWRKPAILNYSHNESLYYKNNSQSFNNYDSLYFRNKLHLINNSTDTTVRIWTASSTISNRSTFYLSRSDIVLLTLAGFIGIILILSLKFILESESTFERDIQFGSGSRVLVTQV